MTKYTTCDCLPDVNFWEGEYDDHLAKREVRCRCRQIFNSDHGCNLHLSKCPGYIPEIKSEFNDYITSLGEVQLKTVKSIILKLNEPFDPKEILIKLRELNQYSNYDINENKLVIDFAGVTRKPKYYRKGKED